jgi:hypothetical protein
MGEMGRVGIVTAVGPPMKMQLRRVQLQVPIASPWLEEKEFPANDSSA